MLSAYRTDYEIRAVSDREFADFVFKSDSAGGSECGADKGVLNGDVGKFCKIFNAVNE